MIRPVTTRRLPGVLRATAVAAHLGAAESARPILDPSPEPQRHVIIAQGTARDYHAHPTTARLAGPAPTA